MQFENDYQFMKYQTKQKQDILNFFKNNPDKHFTVEDVLKHIGNKVSVATIYRQVEQLVDEGYIQKIIFDNTSKACFQYKNHDECDDHFHLICEKCGRLIHLECDEINHIVSHISDEHDFKVNKTKVVFYGICDECRGK